MGEVVNRRPANEEPSQGGKCQSCISCDREKDGSLQSALHSCLWSGASQLSRVRFRGGES
jgi:hypothetical protein